MGRTFEQADLWDDSVFELLRIRKQHFVDSKNLDPAARAYFYLCTVSDLFDVTIIEGAYSSSNDFGPTYQSALKAFSQIDFTELDLTHSDFSPVNSEGRSLSDAPGLIAEVIDGIPLIFLWRMFAERSREFISKLNSDVEIQLDETYYHILPISCLGSGTDWIGDSKLVPAGPDTVPSEYVVLGEFCIGHEAFMNWYYGLKDSPDSYDVLRFNGIANYNDALFNNLTTSGYFSRSPQTEMPILPEMTKLFSRQHPFYTSTLGDESNNTAMCLLASGIGHIPEVDKSDPRYPGFIRMMFAESSGEPMPDMGFSLEDITAFGESIFSLLNSRTDEQLIQGRIAFSNSFTYVIEALNGGRITFAHVRPMSLRGFSSITKAYEATQFVRFDIARHPHYKRLQTTFLSSLDLKTLDYRDHKYLSDPFVAFVACFLDAICLSKVEGQRSIFEYSKEDVERIINNRKKTTESLNGGDIYNIGSPGNYLRYTPLWDLWQYETVESPATGTVQYFVDTFKDIMVEPEMFQAGFNAGVLKSHGLPHADVYSSSEDTLLGSNFSIMTNIRPFLGAPEDSGRRTEFPVYLAYTPAWTVLIDNKIDMLFELAESTHRQSRYAVKPTKFNKFTEFNFATRFLLGGDVNIIDDYGNEIDLEDESDNEDY